MAMTRGREQSDIFVEARPTTFLPIVYVAIVAEEPFGLLPEDARQLAASLLKAAEDAEALLPGPSERSRDEPPIRCGTFNAELQARLVAEREQRIPAWVEFGSALRATRVALPLTLRIAAARARMQPADYSALETGRACPPRDVSKLLSALGIMASSPNWHRLHLLAEECYR